MQFLLPRHLAIFSKPILFVALLGVVSASVERSNLRGNDRVLIPRPMPSRPPTKQPTRVPTASPTNPPTNPPTNTPSAELTTASQAPVDPTNQDACHYNGDTTDHDHWLIIGPTRTCKCNNGQWLDCYDIRDDPTFNWWSVDGRGCEWVRGIVDYPKVAYQDENNNYDRSECMNDTGKGGELCPSCDYGEISDACPSVCA